jgi:hypothetical protein
MIGVTCGALGGVFIVIECFTRNAVASAALGVEESEEVMEGVEKALAGVEDVRASFSIFLRFFFSFFSVESANHNQVRSASTFRQYFD